ncbi:MAG: DUF2752 domain-containing protein [Lachnospiraceae bacterium]|nr:DUF2752 domain-containing protein [Lachnospiraceae bacterium]
MNKKNLLRDFIIANIAGGLSGIFMLIGIFLQEFGVLPKFPCTFLYTTHMYCPGCGGTRALLWLFKGRVIKSICYNPAVFLGVILILYYEVTVLLTIISKKDKKFYTKSIVPVIIYVSIVLVFAVIRDILLVGFGIDMLG